MLKTNKLTKVYRTEDVETTAINSVDISVEEGEFVSVMGPSGCGKSTLLNVLGLLDSPSGGEYYFLEEEISGCDEKQRAALRKENIGFIFQSFNLIDELTVYENMELPLLYLKVPPNDRKDRVTEKLEQMQLTPRKNHYPQQLSGGQQQRVAVARALICDPKLILADEPTGNLDSKNGDEVMKLIADLNEKGTTVIMVTHSSENTSYSNRTIHLLDGEIVNENAGGS